MKKSVLVMTGLIAAWTAHGAYYIDDGSVLPITADWNLGTNAIVVGNVNSGNGLTIFNGADVLAGWAYVGFASGSSNNFINLAETSSLSLGYGLVVGHMSAGNTMEIMDESVVYTLGSSWVGLSDGANNNAVTVSGSGAEWITEGTLFVGSERASGNAVRILDGGLAISRNGAVGVGSDADNNRVLISGSGAEWVTVGVLRIGSTNSSGNAVTVTNGGSMVIYDGLQVLGSANAFNLEQDGRLTVFSDFDASMNGFNFNDGGALYVGGVLSNAPASIEGGRTLGLTGTNAWWNRSGSNVVVGAASSGNTLAVESGALVDAGDVLVGEGDTAIENSVSVSGDGTLLNIADSLSIGTVSNSGNVVEVSAGGTIRLGGDLLLGGSSNIFNLGEGGFLVASNGLDASAPGFHFLAGGSLESYGTLNGLDSMVEDERRVVLNGSNAVWNLGTNILYLGHISSSNKLLVLDGAHLAGGSALVGSTGTTENLVHVSGLGSIWTNSGDLTVEGYLNDLVVANEGLVHVDQSLSVKNESAISLVSGGHAAASSYYQDATSVFLFDNVTNTPAVPALLQVDGMAEFEGGATLRYAGAISGLDRGVVFTNRLVSAGLLVVDGVTNATDADLDVLNVTGLGSLLSIDLVSEDNDLIALISRMRLAESAGFEPGSDLAEVSEEIDQLADGGDPSAGNMLDVLSQLDSEGQNAQLSQLYDRHAPSYAHTKGMMDGFRQARMRGVVPNPMLPRGAFGPHFYNTPLRGWIKGYGSWGQRDGAKAFSGYDQSIYGVLLGVEQSFGDLLAGVAGGLATSDIDQDDGDSSEAQTGYGLLYASWGTVSWFGDLNFGYGRSAIEENSGTLFNTGAEYDADQLGFYLGGGKEMVFRDDRLFVTPSAALSGSYYLQESYVESSTTAVPRQIDEFDHLSIQSGLGLKVSYTHELMRTVLVPEMHANWLHEFNADEERIGYSLVGGTGRYSFAMQAPVEDLYEIGTGVSWWMFNKQRKVFEWYAGLDGRFGDGYTEATVSLRLVGQF